MRSCRILTTPLVWLFMFSIALSSMQVAVAGFQTDENSWFSYMVNVMAEEETEDSETEESEVKDAEWTAPISFTFAVADFTKVDSYRSSNPYISFVGEVTSPPPEA